MALLLGVDTGGTYTDAVVLDDISNSVLGRAKSLTTRPDLSVGVGRAIDMAISGAAVLPSEIAMVSLSTTLATNALVEGQGGRVALVFIGFDETELSRAGLPEALAGDPVIFLSGGHSHAGTEIHPFEPDALRQSLSGLPDGVTGFAVASSFATRNPAHEILARDVLRSETGKPVTCSHELSSALGGPKRALTAVLNARLIGMIDRLISACESHLNKIGIDARLMIVRGDGALVSSTVAREKPIETILSGPAASIAGASWLTGEADALVSDIGGTTTDVCLLRGGRPAIDPQGAQVGPFRTMVEAVAMRTHGLGGDSEVHLADGLNGGLQLGPRRVLPVALVARDYPDLVLPVLERAARNETPAIEATQFVVPLWTGDLPTGLDGRESAIAGRLAAGPVRLPVAVSSRIEAPALRRLVARGLVQVSGVTPSDAAHVLGLVDAWDGNAAELAMQIMARKRDARGERLAQSPQELAQRIVDQVTIQTCQCLLQAAFAEDARDWEDVAPDRLASHPLTQAGLDRHQGIVHTQLHLGVPVVGLGASAGSYYGAVGARLGTKMVVPQNADVANAIGAVVGQVSMQVAGTVSSSGAGQYRVHLPDGPVACGDEDAALALLETTLRRLAAQKAQASGVEDPRLQTVRDVKRVEVEGTPMFISAELRVTASGRPRIARDEN